MGRAGRPHNKDLLYELREEGIPDGWGRYWHGSKDLAEREPSRILENKDLDRLEDSPMSRAERMVIARKLRTASSFDKEDSAFRSLWEQELLRSKELLQSSMMPLEELHQRWISRIEEEWVAGKVPETSLWADVLQGSPNSVTLRALARSNDKEFHSWVKEDLLPLAKRENKALFSFRDWRTYGDPIFERICKGEGMPSFQRIVEDLRKQALPLSKIKETELARDYLQLYVGGTSPEQSLQETVARGLQDMFEESQEYSRADEITKSIFWEHKYEVPSFENRMQSLRSLWSDDEAWLDYVRGEAELRDILWKHLKP